MGRYEITSQLHETPFSLMRW